jgi:AraC-like DNA-binding protein
MAETPSTVDNDDWRGTVEQIEVSPTLHVHRLEAEARRDIDIEPWTGCPGSFLASQVVIEGQAAMTLGERATERARRDCALLFRAPDQRVVYRLKKGARLVMAGYALAIDRVAPLLDGEVPPALRPLLEPGTAEVRSLSHPASPALRAIAGDLFAPGLNGALRRLTAEGAALHLLALQAAAVARQSSLSRDATDLTPREREAAREAHRLLLADLREPPSLDALAAAVGLGRKRLNTIFRRAFGATVFELLKRERLERACLALAAGGVTLKQAAFSVGYDHVTNFISAFRARFGAPPVQFIEGKAGRSQP